MQTHEWEGLLDGTTPGPWFTNVGGFGRIESIGPISTGFSIGDGLDCDEDDATLAAHAPAAVAEVIRLRREIEGLRKAWDASATLYVKRALAHPTSERYDILSETHTRIAHELARILEGDTDE